jgi:hypothetical protein
MHDNITPGEARLSETPTTAIRIRDLGMTPTTRIPFGWRRRNLGLHKAIGEAKAGDARGLVQRIAAALSTWRGMPVADADRGRLAGELLGLPSGDVETLTISLLAHLHPDGVQWAHTCPACKRSSTQTYDLGAAEVACWGGAGEPPGALYALREPVTLGPAVVRVLTLSPPSHGGLYAHHRPGAVNVAQLLADAIESGVTGTDDPRIGRLPTAAVEDLDDRDAAAIDRALQAITLTVQGAAETTCPACGHTVSIPLRALSGVF